jgi:hypothetical protein
MSKATSRRLAVPWLQRLFAANVQSQANSIHRIYGVPNDSAAVFSPVVLFSPVTTVSQILHTRISLSTAEDLKPSQVTAPLNKAQYLCSSLCCPPVNLPTYSQLLVSCHKANATQTRHIQTDAARRCCSILVTYCTLFNQHVTLIRCWKQRAS